jgi:hypothetical protein
MALGLLSAGGLWFALRSAPKSSADEPPAADATPIAAAVAKTETSKVPPPPPVAVPAPAAPQDQAPRVEKTDDPNAPYAFDETPEDLNERVAERSGLMSRFSRETADATWTGDAGRRVVEQLARANLQSGALRAVDCRQTICRFVLASSTNTRREFGGLIQAARDFEEETWLHPEQQDDGTWRTEVFFPKQGYRLSGGGGRIDEARRAAGAPDDERSSKGG